MKYHVMGYYDTPTKTLQWDNKEQWPSKGPPPDATIRKQIMLTVSYQVGYKICLDKLVKIYYVVSIFSLIGLGLCIFFFLFNRRYAGRV